MEIIKKVLSFQRIEGVDYVATCTAGIIVWLQLFTLVFSLLSKFGYLIFTKTI